MAKTRRSINRKTVIAEAFDIGRRTVMAADKSRKLKEWKNVTDAFKKGWFAAFDYYDDNMR